ncbi:hypothetical protein ABID19_002995 [Mesorhizobium robiniae]|uniref:Uncharacterized protein n=1 Tax=Mesorhizobium robiniae TaxID=559315 RepID=A0ABV2GNU5_9HYPH
MKTKVLDPQDLAGSREGRADRVRCVREDLFRNAGRGFDYRQCFLLQIAPHIVPNLLARVLHSGHEYALAFLVQVSRSFQAIRMVI